MNVASGSRQVGDEHARAMSRGRHFIFKAALLVAALMGLMAWAAHSGALEFSAGWNLYLVPGALLGCASMLAYALRFRTVLHVVGLRLSVPDALRINTFALFCHFFVPFAAGADLTKFVKLRGLAPERRAVVGAAGIVLEHLIGLAAVLALVAVLFITLEPLAVGADVGVFGAIGVLLLIGVGIVVVRRQNGERLDLRRLCDQLSAHRWRVAAAAVLSVAMQFLLAAAVHVGSLGWGLEIGFWHILFVLSAASVFQAVPANVAGIGPAEVAGTGLYLALGVSWPGAVLLVSLLFSYRLLVAVIGGTWELLALRRASRSVVEDPTPR